jgi:hypothetical protein
MKRPTKVTEWIGVAVALAAGAAVVYLMANSGPVAAIWPAAQ